MDFPLTAQPKGIATKLLARAGGDECSPLPPADSSAEDRAASTT
jgi:hypothetical protein